MHLFRLLANFGQFGGMGQRLIFKVPANEWNDFASIEGDESVNPVLDDLQLGSCSIDVDHSESLCLQGSRWRELG